MNSLLWFALIVWLWIAIVLWLLGAALFYRLSEEQQSFEGFPKRKQQYVSLLWPLLAIIVITNRRN